MALAELVGRHGAGDSAETVTVEAPHEPSTSGTPPYMSPEQAAGKPLDARSDIFSFGAVLYEMATGRRAFDRPSGAETLAAVLHEQPAPPRTLAPTMPEALERIILRCLTTDPDRRFQHASDLKVELEEVQENVARTDSVANPRVSHTRGASRIAAYSSTQSLPFSRHTRV